MKRISLIFAALLSISLFLGCPSDAGSNDPVQDNPTSSPSGTTDDEGGETTGGESGSEEGGSSTGGETTGGESGTEEGGSSTGGETTGGESGSEEGGTSTGGETTGGESDSEEGGTSTGGESTGGESGTEEGGTTLPDLVAIADGIWQNCSAVGTKAELEEAKAAGYKTVEITIKNTADVGRTGWGCGWFKVYSDASNAYGSTIDGSLIDDYKPASLDANGTEVLTYTIDELLEAIGDNVGIIANLWNECTISTVVLKA